MPGTNAKRVILIGLLATGVGCSQSGETAPPAGETPVPVAETAPPGAPAEEASVENDEAELMIHQSRAHLMPGMGAVYLSIHNPGDEGDRLVSVETAVAKAAETHETVDDNGIMRMVAHPQGFDIPAGGMLELTPGGKHIMLIEPEESASESIALTLHFERSGAIEVDVPLTAPGEMAEGGMHH